MSKTKVSALLISSLFLVLITFLNVKLATAANVDLCPGSTQTNPSPLLSNSNDATFIVPVSYTAGITEWKIEFTCGRITNQTTNASFDSTSQSITASITRNTNPGAGCEFFSGSRTLLVKATINGNDRDWCQSTYRVIDADSQCKLAVDPARITPTSDVTISGENLNNGGATLFGLFMDNDIQIMRSGALDVGQASLIGTSSFSNFNIPPQNLTLGTHTVYLKRLLFLSPVIVGTQYGPRLCSKSFNVGTSTSPGGVSTGTLATSEGQTANCIDDPNNPAISTAIGCIHTNPATLAKDILTFVIGISGGLAFLIMLLGTFQMLTSAGNPETLNAGKDRLTSAIIGLLFIIFSVLLLQIIGVSVLSIPGFGK